MKLPLYFWSLGMDNKCHPTLYWVCDYLSMLGLKSINVRKKGPSSFRRQASVTWLSSIGDCPQCGWIWTTGTVTVWWIDPQSWILVWLLDIMTSWHRNVFHIIGPLWEWLVIIGIFSCKQPVMHNHDFLFELAWKILEFTLIWDAMTPIIRHTKKCWFPVWKYFGKCKYHMLLRKANGQTKP